MTAAFSTTATSAAAAPSGPVTADGPLAFTIQTAKSFGLKVFCTLAYTGGTAPVTIRWTVNGAPQPQFDDRRTLSRPCSVPSFTQVSVVVADAAGSSIGFGRSVRYTAGFPNRPASQWASVAM